MAILGLVLFYLMVHVEIHLLLVSEHTSVVLYAGHVRWRCRQGLVSGPCYFHIPHSQLTFTVPP